MANTLVRCRLRQRFHPTLHLDQPARHLAGVETWRDGIAADESRTQLHGQILRQMDHCRLGGGIAVCGVGTKSTHSNPCHRGGDYNAGRVVDRTTLAEQRFQLLHAVEDTLDVQVHHFGERIFRVALEWGTPGSTGIGEKDVNMVGRFGYFGREALNLGKLGKVGRDGDGLGAGALVGECVQRGDGFITGVGFAGGNINFGTASLHQTGRGGC